MYIYDFYRNFFVPVCLSRTKIGTRRLYDQIIDLWVSEIGNSKISEISPAECQKFVDLSLEKVSPHSVAKYCRHLNAVFLRMGPPGWRNRRAFGFLDYPPYCQPPRLETRLPKQVTDRDLLKLIDALGDNDQYPKSVEQELRPLWWRALCLFAATTAVRKQVIFGLKWEAVDLQHNLFFVSPELDKAHTERIKYLHPKLSRMLLQIRTADPFVFVWPHGNKKFYKIWGQASEAVGVKLTLHDLKRYASQLAIRSGADVTTLREFCDHSNIATTLQHYARGDVQQLIGNLRLPQEVWND
jgi:integrase